MCGIGGILQARLERDALELRLRAMQQCLRHRGPDDHGIFISANREAGLAHTRLSILDLSASGHQPMSSPDQRLHIVFNGEIYNFQELRSELLEAGETFQSNSDTEVILKMYARYGGDCVREFAGMFAFAIWDQREKACFFARGPLGVKPLYYWRGGGALVFGSEVRAILASGLVPRTLSSTALQGYFMSGAVAEPETLVRDIVALSPGERLTWRDGAVRSSRYWNVHFEAEPYTAEEAAAHVRRALDDSVQRHLISDVPVGVFLSGGIDSTSVVALAPAHRRRDLRTFCISFDDQGANEGDVARRTAEHFGTEHYDWRLDAATAKGLLNEFLARSDQPSVDGFNTFCVSKHAHDQGTKVVLSGLGGDELFGGYPSFRIAPQMMRTSRALNPVSSVRAGVGRLLERVGRSPRARRLGAFLMERPTSDAAYWCMRGIFTPRESAQLVQKYCPGCRDQGQPNGLFPVPSQPTLEDEISYLELTRYMRNQLLRDSDVMSMAWGLELRVPFVDSKLIDAVARIPAHLRLASGKQILLDAIPELPDWVAERPKRGFAFPFEDWIRGEWGDRFEQIELNSPVRLQSWYRRWCLFALESFIERNGLASPLAASA